MSTSGSLSALLREAAQTLASAGVPTPDVDAELLAAHVFGLSRGELAAAVIRGADVPDGGDRFEEFVARRAAREPLQHLTGLAPFRHLELRVGPGVFVPRPETEMVAQLAIDALRAAPDAEPIAVDFGTGSGAIALAMATEVPHAAVHAAENSVDAFLWAKENFAEHAPQARLAFIDLASAFPELDGQVAVLVSNPPYVPDDAIPRDPEVRFWDPPAALYGGADGLERRPRAVGRGAPAGAPRRNPRDRARGMAGTGDPRAAHGERLARRRDPPRPDDARPRDDGHPSLTGPAVDWTGYV